MSSRGISTPLKLLLFVAAALLLTLASSRIERHRLEVQDWDCPPAPTSCARPVLVGGFPLPYISDYHGISPVGSLSLSGAVLGEDLFDARAFWLDALVSLSVVVTLWASVERLSSRLTSTRPGRVDPAGTGTGDGA